MNRSYYSASIAEFLATSESSIIGELAFNYPFDLQQQQKAAWSYQIQHLSGALSREQDGAIFFEFQIPRVGKRADVVLILAGIVFVIEYKVGEAKFDRASIDQTTDYALDLKNFHAASYAAPIVPILVCTNAAASPPVFQCSTDLVYDTIRLSAQGLEDAVRQACAHISAPKLDASAWISAPYRPTPTIVEAAQALYCNHSVAEISRSDAAATNLTATATAVDRIVRDAEQHRRKTICFITGVPGAGKTLAGLNIATQRQKETHTAHAVFLSGNDPLVRVLREALARDRVRQSNKKVSKKDVQRQTSAFLQNIRHFRDDTHTNSNPPHERVVVFDEAQRAWRREQLQSFMKRKRGTPDFQMSEPEFLLSVMDRHDWCCVVCLVGGGQEINVGEAGIGEWLRALKERFKHWSVYCADRLTLSEYDWDGTAARTLEELRPHYREDLHLSVSLRSFRAEALSDFVSAVIRGCAGEARELLQAIPAYPFALTRDLAVAKKWVQRRARGTERFGLLAASGGLRLRPMGVNVDSKVEPELWFLNDVDDIRSSFYLEEAATEFEVQGLELDWSVVCWDANFRRINGNWKSYKFSGTKWQVIHSEDSQRYVANAYRVLLTRGRQGCITYVPQGDRSDKTRCPEWYDEIYEFLVSCGMPEVSLQ